MKQTFWICILVGVLVGGLGCGVKSKPLPPLKEPWISSGDLEKDRDRKLKNKKQPLPVENRVNFTPPPTPEDQLEHQKGP